MLTLEVYIDTHVLLNYDQFSCFVLVNANGSISYTGPGQDRGYMQRVSGRLHH